MFLNLGQIPTLIVSSPDTVAEIVNNHDVVFSDRPKTTATDILFYGNKTVAFSPYGEYWKETRKECVVQLLSLKRVQSFEFVREQEVGNLVDKVREACLGGTSVNLSQMLIAASTNIVSRCVLGQARKLGGVASEVEDFVDVLLRLQHDCTLDFELTQDHLKAILQVSLFSRIETTSTVSEWLMAELVRNPRVTKKAQEEVRRVLGQKEKDFQFVPFGFGRRRCPGLAFGIFSVEHLIANLLYWFDWKLPNGVGILPEDLDMCEVYGITVHKKVPLEVLPTLYSP
ncbi:hypothetical protein TIFTF001_032277 [Ficus carica]|uniref:Cytochrome P450 n=1 Tax=Ficus carica TaxID=3494 RepID=A0AA88J7R4_FICCA|nr:hypothetical protein TIFTF001_032277 [Ficus carica]